MNDGNGKVKNGNGAQVESGSQPVLRCAIYTRKSTDENLDSDFNSLDAHQIFPIQPAP